MSDLAGHLRAFLDRDRLAARLQSLVRTPSENPPGNEAAAAKLVHGYCEELGLDVTEHSVEPNRPSIVARLHAGDGPTVTYCSHVDVVPVGDPLLWQRDPFGGDIEDGTLHGRGACDAKGPLAAALEAVALLRASSVPLAGTLELALVADEEAMGFKGAGFLVEEGIVRPQRAIVGEPTSLRVVHAQRGACWMELRTRGVAGHGSAPERGVNAIEHMAEIVRRLPETLPDLVHPVVGGPTISVGTIRGGEKVNIIPASCVVEIDRRTVPQESDDDVLKSVEQAIDGARTRFPNLDAEARVRFYARPFEMDPALRIVRDTAAAFEEVLGKPAELVGFRGASDARFLADAGAEVVLWGPGDITLAHTARESIQLDELAAGAVCYATAFARALSAGA